jgi:hypothetical protein
MTGRVGISVGGMTGRVGVSVGGMTTAVFVRVETIGGEGVGDSSNGMVAVGVDG